MTAAEIREYVELTCTTCGVPDLAGKIVVRWNPRFTARMGDAYWLSVKGRGVIRLSTPLWPKASHEEQIETVIHETCHVIAAYQHGPWQGHGPNWRALMRLCGYRHASRCHTVNREEIAQRRQQTRRTYKVICGCPEGIPMGRVQFQRLRAGRRYSCRTCGQPVKLPERIEPAATLEPAPLPSNSTKAACGCPDGVRLGPVQMRRLRAGTEYRCRKCGEDVRLL